jgi:hypothetical protein
MEMRSPTNSGMTLMSLIENIPMIKIDFIELDEHFGPELINRLSKEWKIPINFMFIGSPGDHFPCNFKD